MAILITILFLPNGFLFESKFVEKHFSTLAGPLTDQSTTPQNDSQMIIWTNGPETAPPPPPIHDRHGQVDGGWIKGGSIHN